ncbi:MAG: DNA/RNA nuclease SfsA [Desulfonatronovibrio sp. MSAO_Bac4]|nr:MAG: DNA/RNA nuclease SfsA [Desulfonatronovibrio sp. MSAO_Bac4]
MKSNTLRLPDNCFKAVFQKREKRFIIQGLKDGQPVSAHTNNSGSMLGLLRPGREMVLSISENPARKLPYTLELIKQDNFWVGVNTLTPNKMLRLAWQNRLIPEFQGYEHFRPEAKAGQSRLDACLQGADGTLWVEAKNVTLVEDERACFPDAVSKRATKHMFELISIAEQGYSIACFYLIQRPDCHCFGPADFIDPEFARTLKLAADKGLKILAYKTHIDEAGISLGQRLPVFWG